MTGYGSGDAESPAHRLKFEVELTSVNRKTLDLNVSCPREWVGLEQKCNEWLKGRFERGRLQATIKPQSLDSKTGGLEWNDALIEETLRHLAGLAEKNGVELDADGELLLRIAQSTQGESSLPNWPDLEADIKTAFLKALDDLNSMRTTEGKRLQADLSERIAELEELRQLIAEESKGTVARYRDALLERLSQLNLALDLSDERVLKEIALFADRCDISEELTRLASHFDQFNELLGSGGSCGRKMDFLCQEIHREFNTIGSKANQIEITRAVLDCKNALERVREQVQNIE